MNKSNWKNAKNRDSVKFGQGCEVSPLRVPVSASGLLKAGRPSQMPTRERSAPTSAWSCRHCHQDCAPASLATLATMPSPPGQSLRSHCTQIDVVGISIARRRNATFTARTAVFFLSTPAALCARLRPYEFFGQGVLWVLLRFNRFAVQIRNRASVHGVLLSG